VAFITLLFDKEVRVAFHLMAATQQRTAEGMRPGRFV
jgi:hypothetical protein